MTLRWGICSLAPQSQRDQLYLFTFLLGRYGTLEFVNYKATQRVEEDLEVHLGLLRFLSHCFNPTVVSASLAIEFIEILVIQ